MAGGGPVRNGSWTRFLASLATQRIGASRAKPARRSHPARLGGTNPRDPGRRQRLPVARADLALPLGDRPRDHRRTLVRATFLRSGRREREMTARRSVAMSRPPHAPSLHRCAIYTRKSSEDGLKTGSTAARLSIRARPTPASTPPSSTPRCGRRFRWQWPRTGWHEMPRWASAPSLLTGLVYDGTGERMSPTHANKGGRRYRYYVSHSLIQRDRSTAPAESCRVPASDLESIVQDRLCALLQDGAAILGCGRDRDPALGTLHSRRAQQRRAQGQREGRLRIGPGGSSADQVQPWRDEAAGRAERREQQGAGARPQLAAPVGPGAPVCRHGHERTRVFRLSFLAPSMTRAILDGRQRVRRRTQPNPSPRTDGAWPGR